MRTIILALLALAMSASTALAITVDINGTDYYSVDNSRTYDFIHPSNSSSDSEDNKINIVDYILDGRLGDGDHTYKLLNWTLNLNPTDTWFANGAASIIIEEIAGYRNTNTFGYYTMDGVRTEIFSGSDGIGATESFTLSPSAEFGFYLGVPRTSNTYYTEASRNVNNEIHAAIFQVDNSNTYILGFEDLRLRLNNQTYADADYQDMIVKVTINQVPEPSTMLLIGTGLAGLGLLRRRFKK